MKVRGLGLRIRNKKTTMIIMMMTTMMRGLMMIRQMQEVKIC